MAHYWLCLTTMLLLCPAAPPPLDQLQATAETSPNDANAWLALAQELDRLGKEDEAIRAFEKAKSLPAAREALGRYTRIDDATVAAEHYRAAIAGYDHIEQTAADRCRRELIRLTGDVKVLRELLTGQITEATAKELPELVGKCGRPATLVTDLARWTTALPKLAGPVAALAECEGNPSRLLTRIRDQDDPVLYAALARMQTKQPDRLLSLLREESFDRPQQAKMLMAGLQSEPAAIAAMLQRFTAPKTKDSWSEDAFRVFRLGVAGNCLDIAETTLKSWLPAQAKEAQYVYDALLRIYEQSGQFQRAEQLCRQGLRKNDERTKLDFNYHLARALMHQDQEKEALALAKEVAGLHESVLNPMLYVDVLSWFGQHDAAQAEARTVLSNFPKLEAERDIRLRLAALAEYRSDNAAAEGHLLRVLELAPKDVMAHNNLGYFWAEQNRRLADAERVCRFAVDNKDSPDEEATYRDSLGWVYFRQGRLIAAQEQIERALSLAGGKIDGVLWEHYGDIHAARGKHDRAIVAWTHAAARIERSRTHRDDPRPAEIKRKLAAEKG